MTYNEAETRFYLFDPILRQKGYDDRQRLKLETPAPVEPTGPRGRRRRGSGRTDYLFCVQVGEMPRPLAVAMLLADILDKVHEISIDHIEDTHFFTLSQVYEDLLLKMGEKNSDGGQFFTPREVVRAGRMPSIEALEQEIKAREKAARDALAKAAAIDAAVFDLKAVNPNAVAKTDTRTPAEIIASIEAQGEIVSAALSNLKKLLTEPD
ncbi:MAG TPA: hypothetical protein VN300_04565 [Desulfobacterales bacterium]|jgi:hypothetical protein|nr:hypothetical protein [Desulfobacterales bacterium]